MKRFKENRRHRLHFCAAAPEQVVGAMFFTQLMAAHPGENRDLFQSTHRLLIEIPAFAGMSAKMTNCLSCLAHFSNQPGLPIHPNANRQIRHLDLQAGCKHATRRHRNVR